MKKFDLEERTARFGDSVIAFARTIPKNAVTLPIVSQLVRSGTSVGANYCEADCAETRKDFVHKIGICKKESKEARFWLARVAVAEPTLALQAGILGKEANELQLIFITISRNTRLNDQNKI